MMRHSLFLFLFTCLSALPVMAQETTDDYRPFVEEGKQWVYDNYLNFRPEQYNHYYRYYFQGDTAIAGRRCLKMYSENEYNDGRIAYKGAFYEEAKKVYRISPSADEPAVLYDFGSQEGDTLSVDEGELKVQRIFIEQNEDRQLRVYSLSPIGYGEYEGEEELSVYWIEGVGCTKDLFWMIPVPGNYMTLVSCEVNGETLYQYVQPKYTEEGYHEMAIEGKTWNYIRHREDESGVTEEPYSYVVRGDTVIGRTVCKKLYYQDASTERLACTLFESGRDLHVLAPGNRAWTTPYQFGRTDVGRVFDWDSEQGTGRVFWMLHDRDSITVNGMVFQRLTFYSTTIDGGTAGMLTTIEDGPDVWHEIWIEGVGSELNGIEAPVHEKPLNTRDYTRFVSCYENGQCIFMARDFTTGMRLSPATSLINDHSSVSRYFDLSGRRLAAPPAKGMYIDNGRKVVK